jgi:hypothetical protein
MNQMNWDSYLDAVSAAIALPIAPADRPQVIANLQRSAEIASAFLDFPLPDDQQAAPAFRPGETKP